MAVAILKQKQNKQKQQQQKNTSLCYGWISFVIEHDSSLISLTVQSGRPHVATAYVSTFEEM